MKDFYKNISIYGILPVVGKFIGFFLVPIYTRVFQSVEFGQIELVITLVNFLVYFINLEFYTSIGRYFYQKKDLNQQKILISTGLWMTVISTIIVIILCLIFRDFILQNYLSGVNLQFELLIAILWLSIDGIGTYLNVIPRYTKRSKQYVAINSLSILIRVISTIFYVLILDVGIVGVLYGHITGTILGIILNTRLSKSLLSLCFDWKDAKLIFNYAIPLIPGLIISGLWTPILQKSTEIFFSFSVVGLLSFATRITSITTMFRSALLNAWRPLMYENINDPLFFTEVKKNSSHIAFIILVLGSFVTLFSYEICLIVGTKEYIQSYILIPFLCFAGYLQSATLLRGFGPLINDKTYIHSLIIFLSLFVSVGVMWLVKNEFGLYGLGIIIVLYEVVQYFLFYSYTKRFLKGVKSLVNKAEHILIGIFLFIMLISEMNISLYIRCIICLFLITIFAFLDRNYYQIILKNKK